MNVTEKLNLLLVDDTPANLTAMQAILEPLGQNLVTAVSGADALRRVLDHDFAAILLDVQMPGMDGFETARLIRQREHSRHTPIIFVTARPEKMELAAEGYAAGAVEYLIKPIVPEFLRAKVQVFLNLATVRRQLETVIAEHQHAEREILRLNEGLEQRVRERTAELTEAQRVAHVGHWTWEPETDIITWSEEVHRIFGLDPAQPVPRLQEHPQILTPESWARLRPAMEKTLETGTPYELDLELVRPDGTNRWINARGEAVREASGRVVRLRGTAHDITERKRTAEEIRKLNAELEQRVRDRTAQLEAAIKEMESFSYSVSHDLRSPLRAINGFAHILAEEYTARLDAEGQRLLGVISGEAQRMGELIEALLNFSRLGRQEMALREMDMTALANAVVRESVATQPQRNVRWEVQPLPPAHTDPILVRQVWVNLVTNALKFTRTRDPAVIQIGSQRENGEVIYHVADNGAGFDMRYVAKLFGVFQRLHSVEEFPGTGIGLALVQRIIHRHGGRVWAEGKVGEGATFYFTVPPRT